MTCTIYPSCAQRRRTPSLWERGARRARSSLGRPGHLPPNSANANGKGHSARGATQARKQTASNGANSWRKEGEHGARSGGTVWRGFVEEVHPPAHLHSRSPPPAETCATSTDQPAAPVARRRRPTLMPATANRVLWLRKGDLTQIT